MSPAPTIAYLAEGKLYIFESGASPRLVESDFAQELIDRATRTRQQNDWKSRGMGWGFAGGVTAMANETPAEVRRIRFTGLCRGAAAKQLLYALDTDYVGGLFEYDLAEKYERRLFHRNKFRASDLARDTTDGLLAFSLANEDCTAGIAVLQSNGRGLRQVTEGDCVDEAPTWVAGDSKALVFQSAGIGRNQAGFRVSLSPYAIQKLDLEKQEMTTIIEDDSHDYLVPRITADGTLYCIRRPYQGAPSVSPWRVAQDMVLFPLRLVRAVIHFLNFFSIMFSRKPLMTAGGPPEKAPDSRYLMLWGKLIDAEKVLRNSGPAAARSLVPSTWELIRRTPDGKQDVLARGVVAFDICQDGTVVFTNGSAVFHLDTAGNSNELCVGRMIDRVTAL